MKIGFSSEVVDLNNQAPNRNKRECKYYWDELYGLISAAGFQYMEMSYQPKWDFGCRSGIPLTKRSIMVKYQNYENYLKKLQENDLKGICCVHFDPSMFCSGNADMYFGAFMHFAEEAIDYTKGLNGEILSISATPCYYNVKSCCPEETDFAEYEKEFLSKTAGAIEAIAKMAKEAGLKLCIRNDYWTLLRGEKIVSFVKELKEEVYIDADTANLKAAGVDPAKFIKEHYDLIGVVHYTDTKFVDDQEAYLQAMPEFPAKAPTKVFRDIGQGDIDFKEIETILEEKGYDGTVVYNCRNSYQESVSLLRTRFYIQNKLGK